MSDLDRLAEQRRLETAVNFSGPNDGHSVRADLHPPAVFNPRDVADGLNAIKVGLDVTIEQLEDENLVHAAQLVECAQEWLENARDHLVSLANGDDGE